MWFLLAACEPDDPGGGPGDSEASTPLADTELEILPAGQSNMLVPIQVAVNATTRRAWASSNGLPNLAEVDLDAGQLVAVHAVADMPNLHPFVAADDLGIVWLGFDTQPAFLRYDPATGTGASVDTPMLEVHDLVALAGGGAAAAGSFADGLDSIVISNPDGTVRTVADTGGSVLGMMTRSTGELAVMLGDKATREVSGIEFVDPATGAVTGRCGTTPSGITGAFAWMDEMPGFGFVFAQTTLVGAVDCESGAWRSLTVGGENRATMGLGDGTFAVLDRVGGQDRNWGLLRRFNADLSPAGDDIQTGKNSGYGGRDPVTGRLWMNSEGTDELWAMNPGDAEPAARVRLGAHIESLAVDPRNPRSAVWSGRLSTTIGRADLDAGTLSAVDVFPHWPVSPVWLGERCFYLDDLTGEVIEVNSDTLTEIAVLPSPLGPNSTLTLSDLLAVEARGTLFVDNAEANTLAEIDPDSGTILASWALGGNPPEDENQPGKVELSLTNAGIVALRNRDGAATLVDPDQPTIVAFATLGSSASKSVTNAHLMDAVRVSADGDRLWFGNIQIDPTSLGLGVELDGAVQVVSDAADRGLLAWGDDPAALMLFSANGNARQTFETDEAPWGAPVLVLMGEGRDSGVLAGSFDRATLHYQPTGDHFVPP